MIVSNGDFVCTLFLLWRVSLQIAYLLVNGPDCPPRKLFKFQQAKQMINDKDVPSDIGAKQPLGHLPQRNSRNGYFFLKKEVDGTHEVGSLVSHVLGVHLRVMPTCASGTIQHNQHVPRVSIAASCMFWSCTIS